MKTYSQCLIETRKMTTDQIRAMIARCEAQRKPCGIAYIVLAQRSNKKRTNCLREKTYAQRHRETSMMLTDEIWTMIAKREVQGKKCDILYQVLSERK